MFPKKSRIVGAAGVGRGTAFCGEATLGERQRALTPDRRGGFQVVDDETGLLCCR